MNITIFDVEHGSCALIEADTGARMLVDCGYNAITGWRPSYHLLRRGISYLDELSITNYDEDHVDDLPNLQRLIRIGILTRNPTVSGDQLRYLKREGGIGEGISCLARMTASYNQPVSLLGQPNWGSLSFSRYWNSYPYDFVDENNLSIALFVHHPLLSVLFPGDMEKGGWKRLLLRPGFITDLQRVHVLIASHHGRENGCCGELFSLTGWRPQIVIISDDYKQYDTQETVDWYRQRVAGINFYGSTRHVFTTRRDGAIYLSANNLSCSINASCRLISPLTQTQRTLLDSI
jgi:beta-lactamase superfamily II metal-dependent hydrolase